MTSKAKWGNKEYPLFTVTAMEKCPTARYVGGTSVYLCECKQPEKCGGVRQARAEQQPKTEG
ncbi:hypothetical protein PJWF_00101 [Achromobacter phage JWF]|uniref:hypothetical protein n=1 Tax=Achromobacter phage JWF TaxID=1589748 RepID=UPI000588DFD4|nr:hypothetical protein AXJ13_gp087 [Achromobacter phage JWF]AJD82994.1 hypothetical protein PJWF_00101 [Achromobacter phage JWF]